VSASLRFVVCGLSLSSSWGNGHATTYRGLLKQLQQLGHSVLFLERDVPWYRDNRDLPDPDFCDLKFYKTLTELESLYSAEVRRADAVIVGSYTPEGIAVGEWVGRIARGLKAFYDIDTPVTLAQLKTAACEYLSADLIPDYDLYLSFTGGPTLRSIERRLGSPCARVLYCSVDPCQYFPQAQQMQWDLGYLGTYSADRQPALNKLLIEPAARRPDGRFIVAGPMYPPEIAWPQNVERVEHLSPRDHRQFYNSQRLTLNITRTDMVNAGYSPSVRLFEAAACGVPIVSDYWQGLESIFRLGSEILIARTSADTPQFLRQPPEKLMAMADRARNRVLSQHTAAHRASQLETYVRQRLNALAQPRTVAKRQKTQQAQASQTLIEQE
jgi:spore maturation protein CgeB